MPISSIVERIRQEIEITPCLMESNMRNKFLVIVRYRKLFYNYEEIVARMPA